MKARDIFIPEMDEKVAYFLGFVATDGHVSQRTVSIEIQDRDRPLMRQFVDWFLDLGWTFSSDSRTIGKDKYIRLRINSVKLSQILQESGIPKGNKTEIITYSPVVPDKLANHYIRGIIDGDGSLYHHKGYLEVEICSGSEVFLDELNCKISDLTGITRKRIRFHRRAFRIVYYVNDAEQLLDFVYQKPLSMYLPRKKKLYDVEFEH
jgi:intein/homing endonuclease